LDFDFKGFRMSKDLEEDEYRTRLFSPTRLNYKFDSFEKITLPSVLNQTNQNYIWYIYTSEYLPEVYKKKLIDMTKNAPICIFYVKSFREFHARNNLTKNFDSNFCTIRLDDDDGLSPNFIDNLQKYKNEDKSIISHPMGNKVTIQDEKVIKGIECNIPKIAIGLCAIGMNIFNCGNHMKLHKHFKVLYDNTPNMYLYNCSENNDSQTKFQKL